MNPALLAAILLLTQKKQQTSAPAPAPQKPLGSNKALLATFATAFAPMAVRLPMAVVGSQLIENERAEQEKAIANEIRTVAAEANRTGGKLTDDFVQKSAPLLTSILVKHQPVVTASSPIILPAPTPVTPQTGGGAQRP